MDNREREMLRRQAAVCRVFTHPLRIHVLDLLCGGERSVMDLARETRVAQPRLSQQLALMRRLGVVVTRRRGTTILYRLTGDRVRRTCRILHELLGRPGACGCGDDARRLVRSVKAPASRRSGGIAARRPRAAVRTEPPVIEGREP